VERVEQVCRLIDACPEDSLPLARLGAEVGLSAFQVQRAFKDITGVTPRQYQDARRLSRFKDRVRAGTGVTGALYEAGYGSSSRLYERANGRLGMTPDTYRRGGAGMHVRFTTAASPLGRLLVARTERGISAVSLADSDAELEKRLRKEFPRAEIARDRKGLRDAVHQLVRFLEGKQPRFNLPLDVRGTAFQCRVWEELRKIPYGATRTYGEVARAIGRPRAARAVGSACGTNPVALIIPCHRVVRGGGQLGGYGLGLGRKRKLLAQEATKRRRR